MFPICDGKRWKGLPEFPFPRFFRAHGHSLLSCFPSPAPWREGAGGWADVGRGSGTPPLLCSFASRPEWNRFIGARKTVCCDNQLSFYFLAPSSPQSIEVWGFGKNAKTYFLLWSVIFQRGTLINVQYSFYTRDTESAVNIHTVICALLLWKACFKN